MISKGQKFTRQERFVLGEISLRLNQFESKTTGQKASFHKQYAKKDSHQDFDMERLKQLKSKYNQTTNIKNLYTHQKLKPFDTSFKSIKIDSFAKFNAKNKNNNFGMKQKIPSSLTKTPSSYIKNEFERKIEQTSHRLESNIDRVQGKINILKQQYQRRKSFARSQSENGSLEESHHSKIQQESEHNHSLIKEPRHQEQSVLILFSLKSERQKSTSQTQQQLTQKRAYAQQLKNINFIDEIKRKIQEIEKQTKSNLEKKSLEATKSSKMTNSTHKQDHCNSSPNGPEKLTLANFVPNLAQSEVIQTVQRDRLSEKYSPQNRESIQSHVLQNYKFSHDTSYVRPRQSCQIIQVPQVEDTSIRASPVLDKSPFRQKNLEETQMIERNQLRGNLQIVEQQIQNEFVLLINRLAYQAEIDNRFSSEIFKYDNIFTQKKSLKSIILERLKEHYQEKSLKFDQKMFEVSQMQLDPLVVTQKIHKELSTQEIMKAGFVLKKLYDKNKSYFENKLQRCYSNRTIEFFIDELQKCHSLKDDQQINVGHLTSYVNMRTGKNLRNRYFYRLLKRIVKNTVKVGSSFRKEDLFSAFVKS